MDIITWLLQPPDTEVFIMLTLQALKDYGANVDEACIGA